MDMSLVGELLYKDHSCNLDAEPLDFDNGIDASFSQVVISDSLASCILQNFALSRLGSVTLDTDRVNKLFGRNDIKMDTSFLADSLYMTAFKQEIGPKKDLLLDLSIKKPSVQFKGQGANVILKYTLGFDVSQINSDKSTKHLIYDEIKML